MLRLLRDLWAPNKTRDKLEANLKIEFQSIIVSPWLIRGVYEAHMCLLFRECPAVIVEIFDTCRKSVDNNCIVLCVCNGIICCCCCFSFQITICHLTMPKTLIKLNLEMLITVTHGRTNEVLTETHAAKRKIGLKTTQKNVTQFFNKLIKRAL